MAACEECGLSDVSGNIHVPGCSKFTPDMKDAISNSENNSFMAMFYDAIDDRAKKFLATYMADISRDSLKKLGILTEEQREFLVKQTVEDLLSNPSTKACIISGAIVTIQMLAEQGVLNESDFMKLYRDSTDNGWMDG